MSKILKEITIEEGCVLVNNQLVYSNDEKETGAFLKALYKHMELEYGKFFKMDYLSKLGFLSSEILLDNVEEIKTETDEVALVIANASSSLSADVKYQDSISNIPSPALFVYTLPNIVIGEISIRNKFYGEHLFFVQDQYDKDTLLKYTETLFETTATQYAIVGWIEVSIDESYNAQLMLCAK